MNVNKIFCFFFSRKTPVNVEQCVSIHAEEEWGAAAHPTVEVETLLSRGELEQIISNLYIWSFGQPGINGYQGNKMCYLPNVLKYVCHLWFENA